jgi:hypothetical protein
MSQPSVVETSPSAPAATIQPVTAADLGPSWHPGCPIDPRQLRRVEINYIGFDGQTHRGSLIVNDDVAAESAEGGFDDSAPGTTNGGDLRADHCAPNSAPRAGARHDNPGSHSAS